MKICLTLVTVHFPNWAVNSCTQVPIREKGEI